MDKVVQQKMTTMQEETFNYSAQIPFQKETVAEEPQQVVTKVDSLNCNKWWKIYQVYPFTLLAYLCHEKEGHAYTNI